MTKLKTTPTSKSVETFLSRIPDEQRRQDCYTILELMKEVTGEEPKMWGDSIVGLGSYHYRYESGREGDWFLAGFSPRKQNLTVYVMSGLDRQPELLKRLGKFKRGKSCLYIHKIEDIDLAVLRDLVRTSVEHSLRTSL